jgi:hypothetical protein
MQQDMSLAPKDGTKIAVFDEHDQFHDAVWWDATAGNWTDGEFVIRPWLWMPAVTKNSPESKNG